MTAQNYYQTSPTNHYARIVHAANLDGKGYAFPYDDVTPSGGADVSGFVADGAPKLLTVAVGGGNATASLDEASKAQKGIVAGMPSAGTKPESKGKDGQDKKGTTPGWIQKAQQKVGACWKTLDCFKGKTGA